MFGGMDVRERALRAYELMEGALPDAKFTLNFRNPYELLVAVVLAARYRDELVNRITPRFFERFPDARALAEASVEEILQYIKGVNMARVKAQRLKQIAQELVRRWGGRVPASMEELVSLPGVGRKSANVVLGNAMGIVEGIEVDSHIARVSYRIGLSSSTDPDRIEQDLMAALPRERWLRFSHLAKEVGRRWCRPSSPRCGECPVEQVCLKRGVNA